MEIKKGEGDGGKTRRKRTTRTAKEAKKRWRKNVRAKDIDVPPSPMRWEGEEEKVTSTLVENIRALSNARFQKMEEGEPPGAVRFTARIAKKFLLRHSTPDPTFSASAKLGFGSTRTRGWGREGGGGRNWNLTEANGEFFRSEPITEGRPISLVDSDVRARNFMEKKTGQMRAADLI